MNRRVFLGSIAVGTVGLSGCVSILERDDDEPRDSIERFEAALDADDLSIESIEHENSALNVVLDYTGDLSELTVEMPDEDRPQFQPPSLEPIIDAIVEVIENHDDVNEISIMFIDGTCTGTFHIDNIAVLAHREGFTDSRDLVWRAAQTYRLDCP